MIIIYTVACIIFGVVNIAIPHVTVIRYTA